MPTYNPSTYTVTYSGNEFVLDRWTPDALDMKALWDNVYNKLKTYLGSETSYSVNGTIQFTLNDTYNLNVISIELEEGILPPPSGLPYKLLRFIFDQTIPVYGISYLEVRIEPNEPHAMFLGPTYYTYYINPVLNISDETYYYLMVDVINIAYDLTNCESSNRATYVNNGDSYVTTLSSTLVGDRLTSVTVKMGINDITATVYDSTTHTINIPRVTRDVVITAVAEVPVVSITYNLTDCESSNTQTSITQGLMYTTTITKNIGYDFTLVRVTLDGVDVTESAYNPITNTISLQATGNIAITARATLGAISLELYENSSEQNEVDKSSHLTLVDTISGILKEATSITSPSIIIQRNTIDFNYVKISSLNRYYFVEEVVSVRNRLWQIRLKVDVLMTYKTTIYNQTAFVERYGNAVTPQHLSGLLVDDKLPVEDIPTYEYYEPTNVSGASVVDFQYYMENDEPNILYTAVTKVVEPVSRQDDTFPPSGTNLPQIQNRRTPNTTLRLLNYSEYGYLLSACISNDAPASFIRSVLLFPFDLRDIFTDYGTKTASVYAGNNALENGSVWGALDSQNKLPVYATGKGGSPYIVVADFIFSSEYGIDIDEDFLDLSSNTEWEIYIPFVGWTQIDARAVVGKEILIYYTVDLDTGLSTVYIYNNDDSQVIWSGTCQLALKLPLASTNAEELARQKQAMGLNLAVGLVSSMLSMGMATPLGAVGGIMMGAKAITSAVNTHNMMIEKAQTSFGSSDNALYAPNKIIIRKVTHKVISQSYVEDVNFNHLYGRPYRKVVKLDDIKGGYYAEIGEVHLTGFDTALKSEVDEIDSLLRDGVYI